MTYKIGLLEADQEQARWMENVLNRYQQNCPEFAYTMQHYSCGRDLLAHYEQDFDLLILGGELPDMTGVEAARRIRRTDRSVMIVFVTGQTQYAVEAYEVQAFDYIVKPVSYERLSAWLERDFRALARCSSGLVLNIRTRREHLRLTSDMIDYIEIFNHDLLIHTDNGVIRQWDSLSKYEALLEQANFARCSSCYLVNLKYVRGICGDEVLVGKERLVILNSIESSVVSMDLNTGVCETLVTDPLFGRYPGQVLISTVQGNNLIVNLAADYYLCTGGNLKPSVHSCYSGLNRGNRILAQVEGRYLVCRDFDTGPKHWPSLTSRITGRIWIPML